ncbi:glycoside hydrolase family 127 protein [Microbacterium indicum]|uniref:glycoside hydrolase family 127 protein n=1 Tax=Microbacterium indicum TaxID=358100 RepID=UPI0004121393|nr:beta-L-arabinofuranosidase domain-containing protein [Microbacterium indicum]
MTSAITTSASPAAPSVGAHARLRPIAVGSAAVTGGLWKQRIDANADASIPEGRAQLEKAKNLLNFRIRVGDAEGEPAGPIFADSDVYKWLEAAAWEYARSQDEGLLRDQLEVTELVARAQDADGYLNTVVPARQERYGELPWSHEHYCAGHLIQAAVAQKRATGRDDLLDVAVRLADHLVATFGPGRTEDIDGHPVIEMALVELFRETGTQAYLDLARWFVDARGHGIIEARGHAPTYFSDRLPVREATTVEGHAVRAVYLAAGAADVAIETGDDALLAQLATQYASMRAEKQYVTGGLGSRWDGEAFGDAHELPNDRAYAETCAAIGGVQWAWRMLLATGEAQYADQIELMLLNGMLAGLSLPGTEYFYVNALHIREGAHPDEERSAAHGRRGWFDCACCPPNIMRTLSSLAGYLATTTDGGVQIHQFAPSTIDAGSAALRVETSYPWDGSVRVVVDEAPDGEFEIAIRVPEWAEGATLDGLPVDAGGYATVTRAWARGDELVLELPLDARFVAAHPRVDEARGQRALVRGPLVYAFEAADNAGVVLDDQSVDPASAVTAEERPDLLGGVTTLRTGDLTAIPYHLWANRGPGAMRVWLPVD